MVLQLITVLCGSLFLCLLSQFAISLSFAIAPITLQTLAVSILAMTLGAKEAPLSVILYLFFAFLGLPVLQNGQTNPYWFVSPTAGYLLGFVFSSYLIPRLLIHYPPRSFFKSWLIFSLNETSVLFIGSLWLSYFIGIEKSFLKGVLPFLPGALAKISLATLFFKTKLYLKST